MKKVLVAFNFVHNKLGDNAGFIRVLNEAAGSGFSAVQGALKEFVFDIKTNDVSVADGVNSCDLKTYDAVCFRLWAKEPERATAAAMYLQHHGIPFWDTEVIHASTSSKLTEALRLGLAGLPIPRSVFMNRERLLRLAENSDFGIKFPFVLKDIFGLKGRLNFLVKDFGQLSEILQAHPDVRFIIQEYIPNDGDYRFLVFGDKVRLVIKRERTSDSTHLNNISQGARNRLIPIGEIDASLLDMAVKAAQVTGREMSGVDILLDSDSRQPYLLEVNSQPEIMTVYGKEKIKALNDFTQEQLKAIA